MVRRARRASLVVVLLLLASVGTASAERSIETVIVSPLDARCSNWLRRPEGAERSNPSLWGARSEARNDVRQRIP